MKFYNVTYWNKWRTNDLGYFHADSHKDAILPINTNVKRIFNTRFREIEQTGKFYIVEEQGNGGKALVFEVVN
jgi:hypothetical protein